MATEKIVGRLGAGAAAPLALALGLILAGCGGGPQVKVTAAYQPKACRGKRVLLVPIAVSDDLGDKRTGIVLSDDTRRLASEGACTRLAQDWDDGTLVCPPLEPAKKSATLAELERAFALDAPVAPALWETLRGSFKADYALLFRPENVTSSNRVTRSAPTKNSADYRAAQVAVMGAMTLSPGTLVGALIGATIPQERGSGPSTSSRTELNYTVSATLLDMRSGRILKVGLNQGSAAQTVPRNLGYAEAPPLVPLLEKIMVPLGEEMLDD